MVILLVIGFFFVIGVIAIAIYSACVVAGRADKVILRDYSHHRQSNTPVNTIMVDFTLSQTASAEQRGNQWMKIS